MYYKEITNLKADKTLGYLYFMDKDHPLSSPIGRVYYHRHLISLKLGRWITSKEHVHHKDGDRKNNKLENLELLSPTEHAYKHHPQRITRPCEVCGTYTKNDYYCSDKCAKLARRTVKRPPLEQLLQDISNMSMLAVGKKYGVSDNAIRKWIKYYNKYPVSGPSS